MKRWLGAVVLVILGLGLGLWWWSQPRAAQPSPTPSSRSADEVLGRASGASDHDEADPSRKPTSRVTHKRKVSAAERDELHRQILASLARRGADAGEDGRAPDEPNRTHDDDAADDDDAHADEDQAEDGEPANRLENKYGDDQGWGDEMTKLLSEDLKPLADECFEAAIERTPNLGRYVEIEFTVVADEDIGGLVESTQMGARNEAVEPEFIECVRESTLSTVFPPPPDSGRRDVMLSLRYDESE